MKVLNTSRSMRKEFKRQLKLAIIAAIGFTIAYSWRETIMNIMETTAFNLAKGIGIGYSPLFMPLLTTLIGVFLIFILSKLLKSQ